MWLRGGVAFDDVVHALSRSRVLVGAGPSLVPPSTGRAIGLGEALVEWRRAGAPIRLVLPVPGDVRGLPGSLTAGSEELRTAALEAGEAVVGAQLGLVPGRRQFGPSSAEPELMWWGYELGPTGLESTGARQPVSVADAQYELAEAVRDSAGPLAEIGAFGWSEEVREQLADARRAGERLNLPPGHPPRAVSLLAQAERLASVLAIARTGVTADRAGATDRDTTLHNLERAVRTARVAGYNAGV